MTRVQRELVLKFGRLLPSASDHPSNLVQQKRNPVSARVALLGAAMLVLAGCASTQYGSQAGPQVFGWQSSEATAVAEAPPSPPAYNASISLTSAGSVPYVYPPYSGETSHASPPNE